MPSEIYLPKMSDHMERGTIARWLVKEGEPVQRGQVILEIETDKAVGEIEAPCDGVLKGVRAGDGEEVPVGETIAFVAAAGETVPALPRLGISAAPTPPARLPSASAPLGAVRATPVARRVAKGLGVDISQIKGSGPRGRVKEADVRAFAASRAPIPEPAASTPSSVSTVSPSPQPVPAPEVLSLSNVQVLTGQKMLESVRNAPHFFLDYDVDMTRALEWQSTVRPRILAESGADISITAILIRVVAAVLKHHPRLNSSFENGQVKLHHQVNLGVAVGTESGLVVPVIKNADQKPLAVIAHELKDFQSKAREHKFTPGELSGGTFTLSNLGMFGVRRFSAIINPPQSAILAVGRVIKTPVALLDDSVVVRPMMSMTLSVDHRSLDGLQGAKFLQELAQTIEEPRFLL